VRCVENRPLWLDIKILCLAVKKTLKCDGISPEGVVTMLRYTGNQLEKVEGN
jgi:hypothetical protein